MILFAIVAATEDGVIGKNGAIPWHLPKDLKRFKMITEERTLIMGRKTYDSICQKLHGPLPNRTSIVLSRSAQASQHENVYYAQSPKETLAKAERLGGMAVVAGGAKVYRTFLPYCMGIHFTLVKESFEGDTYFPMDMLKEQFSMQDEVDGGSVSFRYYKNDNYKPPRDL